MIEIILSHFACRPRELPVGYTVKPSARVEAKTRSGRHKHGDNSLALRTATVSWPALAMIAAGNQERELQWRG